MSVFMDSDEAFAMYRRFGSLHARVLLYKQDELRRLESDLRTMDVQDSKSQAGERKLISWHKDCRSSAGDKKTRQSLMRTIEQKTTEYGTEPSYRHGDLG